MTFKSSGYTILEVLVVISIFVLLATFSYAGVRDFQSRQKLTAIARQLEADLHFAQESALAGKKPETANCTATNSVLESIRFQVVTSNSYRIFARCTNGNGPDMVSRTLPANTTVYISNNNLDFLPLVGGTNIAVGATTSLGVCGFDIARGYTVTSTGEISQNDLFTCP